MPSVYDVYHHSCILLQYDLRLPHSYFHERYHGRCVENGCRVYTLQYPQTGQMEVTSPSSAYNRRINHEVVRVRGCVLVAAFAFHPALLNVTVYYQNLTMTTTTLKMSRTMTLTRMMIRMEKSRMKLMMTWQASATINLRRGPQNIGRSGKRKKNIPLRPFRRSTRLLLFSLLLLCLQDPIGSSTPIRHMSMNVISIVTIIRTCP